MSSDWLELIFIVIYYIGYELNILQLINYYYFFESRFVMDVPRIINNEFINCDRSDAKYGEELCLV